MGRGIYGTSGTAKLIYGIGTKTACDPTVTCATGPLMMAFLQLVESTRGVVDKLFPAAHVTSKFITPLAARGSIPPLYFIRLAWRQKFKGVEWVGTCIQAGQLKDLYLEFGLDFSSDPYVRDYDKVFNQRDLQTGQDGSPTENQASNAEAVNT